MAVAADALVSRLAVSEIDPFRKYPIVMNPKSYRLLRNLYGESSFIFTTMRNKGIFNCITDPAAFTQMLAMSSWHLSTESPANDRIEPIQLSIGAIQRLNRRLTAPRVDLSDNMVYTLLIFCVFEMVKFDMPAFAVHVNGLVNVIKLRGGLQTLAHNIPAQSMAFKFDVMQALLSGTTPHFSGSGHSESYDVRSKRKSLFLTDLSAINDTYILEAVQPCFDILEDLKIEVENEFKHRNARDNTVSRRIDWTSYINQLDSISLDPDLDTLQNDLRDACRVVGKIFTVRVKRALSPPNSVSPSIDLGYVREIQAQTTKSIPIVLINNSIPIRHPAGPLILWLTFMTASCELYGEDKRWHNSCLGGVRRGLGVKSFDEMMEIMNRFPWIDEIFTRRLREMWDKIYWEYWYHG
ncbi:hypothetical protein BP6252_07209 [Coleophoma cylindrospora]|uniref:Uncharacterized protein n=1 Tax=Coleophoma cylindrospora TaxID=1849047 RepID=A0A3D8RGY8_9HELO|nr:hypothetical protein BP6252_07209 [Coleophoma cylindrospora]